MSLKYKILWIDDQVEEFIELGYKEDISTYLSSLGFEPVIDCFEDTKKVMNKLEIMKYDLILSDYNIEGSGKGDDLITKIRDGKIFTEILFYSAQKDIIEAAKSLFQDRISFFTVPSESGYKELIAKIKWLINQTISKLQELNSMRGVVMAETSNLDNIIEDILFKFFEGNSTNKKTLREYILNCIKSSVKSNFDKKDNLKIYDKSDSVIVKSRIFDADKKARAINKIIQLEKIDNDPDFTDFYNKYKEDVLTNRNDLAHAKSDVIDGIEYLITVRKDGEQPVKIDSEKCIEIRKNLIKYKDTLDKLSTRILES